MLEFVFHILRERKIMKRKFLLLFSWSHRNPSKVTLNPIFRAGGGGDFCPSGFSSATPRVISKRLLKLGDF